MFYEDLISIFVLKSFCEYISMIFFLEENSKKYVGVYIIEKISIIYRYVDVFV